MCKVTEVMEQMGANCLQMSGLEGIYPARVRHYRHAPALSIQHLAFSLIGA